jgi:hypothetical protein
MCASRATNLQKCSKVRKVPPPAPPPAAGALQKQPAVNPADAVTAAATTQSAETPVPENTGDDVINSETANDGISSPPEEVPTTGTDG